MHILYVCRLFHIRLSLKSVSTNMRYIVYVDMQIKNFEYLYILITQLLEIVESIRGCTSRVLAIAAQFTCIFVSIDTTSFDVRSTKYSSSVILNHLLPHSCHEKFHYNDKGSWISRRALWYLVCAYIYKDIS